ncbi:uncharacterized protein [Agelaius tricolor]|uniref:uncharacterized protein n=1 Tax=Agelaius tricolor TaxID=9191 RepID=UPI0039F1F7B0
MLYSDSSREHKQTPEQERVLPSIAVPGIHLPRGCPGNRVVPGGNAQSCLWRFRAAVPAGQPCCATSCGERCVCARSEHRGKLGVMLGVGGVKSREVVPHPPWILLGISPAAEPSCCGVEQWQLLFLNDFNSSFGLTDQICHQLCHFPTKTGRKHTKTEKRISTARSIFSSLWTTKYSDLVETNISLLSSFFHHLLSLSPTRKIYMNSWKSLQKPKRMTI